ncbi:hypothetical protein [Brevibacterium aurantiacum]|uniref:hypothetical protein n=1 Tax=Brevibacterium aurantiacum TaxID=273384 RepID=UPI00384D6EEB
MPAASGLAATTAHEHSRMQVWAMWARVPPEFGDLAQELTWTTSGDGRSVRQWGSSG